ncbi:hypothetical protein sos41_29340 [Alphaproteobacteria bacterium SO-S41]|nr:hypothetical protein sos41_29340 [Alphaproteobacteria bacterium SO-S41]
MTLAPGFIDALRASSAASPFNQWSGFEVVSCGEGTAELAMAWKAEATQHVGFLHAGVVGALIDTVCGYAAATRAGPVLTSHYSVNFMVPAVGTRFRAVGRVVRAGKRQIFTAAELYAEKDGTERLVATGEALLMPVAG